MKAKIKMVICPCCSAMVIKAKYCPECGSPLTDVQPIKDSALAKPVSFENGCIVNKSLTNPSEKEALSDKDLTLLVKLVRKELRPSVVMVMKKLYYMSMKRLMSIRFILMSNMRVWIKNHMFLMRLVKN